ncbi:hypothetical protein IF1G_01175 [Cordyceps javanica]|uniref:Uncharacterized protein n=1 Tax=Cordyceps javanica TaxID=43265 RepID=A0A545VHP4_9HYPO|nr:hypothetical protein IF1G_01175 [Cordyceps javanica]TQW12394.1 hypothetical protein IF2G_01125 [Cordyceps javanica]
MCAAKSSASRATAVSSAVSCWLHQLPKVDARLREKDVYNVDVAGRHGVADHRDAQPAGRVDVGARRRHQDPHERRVCRSGRPWRWPDGVERRVAQPPLSSWPPAETPSVALTSAPAASDFLMTLLTCREEPPVAGADPERLGAVHGRGNVVLVEVSVERLEHAAVRAGEPARVRGASEEGCDDEQHFRGQGG